MSWIDSIIKGFKSQIVKLNLISLELLTRLRKLNLIRWAVKNSKLWIAPNYIYWTPDTETFKRNSLKIKLKDKILFQIQEWV